MANLFERARAGDTTAAAEVQRLVAHFARHVCFTGGPHGTPDFDWEDVAQEATVRLLQHGPGQFRGAGAESSYIYTVAKCTVIQMARSSERRRRREDAVAPSAHEPVREAERRIDVRKILARLDENCRTLIERILFNDETYGAIAQELNLTASSVRSRMHRCLGRARALVTEEAP